MIANLKIGSVLLILFWSLFMGVTAISIGVGALFPQINYIAGPVVCPGGSLSTEKQNYTVSPVESVTTITMYCNDRRTGTSSEVDVLPVSLVAGPIYGVLLFLVILAVMLVRAQRPAPADDWTNMTGSAADSSGAQAKIEELNELRAANQISDAVYQKRKQEILSNARRAGG